jgi:transcriptional regulator with XRE-family HTH domain
MMTASRRRNREERTAAVERRRSALDDENQEIERGLGAAVEALRMSRGFSRAALAKAAQLDRSAVFKIEAGQRIPAPETVTKLATALNVSEEELRKTGWVAAAADPRERWRRVGLAVAGGAVTGAAATGAAASSALAALAPGPALLAAAAALTRRSLARGRARRSDDDYLPDGGRRQLLREAQRRVAALDDDSLRTLLVLLPPTTPPAKALPVAGSTVKAPRRTKS